MKNKKEIQNEFCALEREIQKQNALSLVEIKFFSTRERLRELSKKMQEDIKTFNELKEQNEKHQP